MRDITRISWISDKSAGRVSMSLRAQVSSYRHVSRGIVPPASEWAAAGAASATAPHGLLRSDELLARERCAQEYVVSRLQHRQAELRDVPEALPRHVRVAAALERALPNVLALQRRVRNQVLAHADRSALADEAQAPLSQRRVRRQRQPRELREAERLDRKRTADTDQRRKKRRDDFLNALTAHHNDFKG